MSHPAVSNPKTSQANRKIKETRSLMDTQIKDEGSLTAFIQYFPSVKSIWRTHVGRRNQIVEKPFQNKSTHVKAWAS